MYVDDTFIQFTWTKNCNPFCFFFLHNSSSISLSPPITPKSFFIPISLYLIVVVVVDFFFFETLQKFLSLNIFLFSTLFFFGFVKSVVFEVQVLYVWVRGVLVLVVSTVYWVLMWMFLNVCDVVVAAFVLL